MKESGLYQKYVSKPVDLGVIKSKRYTVSNNYKEGDLVDEDDLEKATGQQESGQGFSETKKDKDGNSYVIRTNFFKED